MQCECDGTDFDPAERPHSIVVSERRFDANLPAIQCRSCGMKWIALDDVAEFEADVARQLEAEGPFTEEAKRFVCASRT
jgi:hypothetical protein